MSRASQAILVVEDERTKRFGVKYLKESRLFSGEARVQMSPAGQGDAKQWVRKQYAIEVAACRRRQAETLLLVVVDADKETVQVRLHQLEAALQENGLDQVAPSERIARLIPKRNIETWILCLNHQVVDEQTDYKSTRNNWDTLIRTAARELHEATQSKSEATTYLDSLQKGLCELARLQPS